MRNIIVFDNETKQFTVKSPLIFDLNKDWGSQFRTMILTQFRSGDYLKVKLARKSSKLPVTFKFVEGSILQIYLLKLLKKNISIRKSMVIGVKDGLVKLTDRINNIYGSTIRNLNILRDDLTPSGYEDLDNYPVRGSKGRSIENYGAHRIVYASNYPRVIMIGSILFHYDDKPRDHYDWLIFDYYQYLVEESPSDIDIRLSVSEFIDELDISYIRDKLKSN